MPSVTWPDRLAIAAPPELLGSGSVDTRRALDRWSPQKRSTSRTCLPGPGHRRSIHPTVRLGLKGLSSRHPRMSPCDRAQPRPLLGAGGFALRHGSRKKLADICCPVSEAQQRRPNLTRLPANGRPRDPSGRRPVVRPDRARPARAGQRAASASPGSDSPTRPCPDSRRRRRPSSALVQHRGDGKLPPRRATRRNVLPLRRTTQFASGMEPRCRRCRRPRGVTLDWI